MSLLKRAPHLTALVVMLGLASLGLAGFTFYVRGVARHAIHHFANAQTDSKILGVTIIREAFRHPDILPDFGSSEMIRGRGRPFYGPAFFANAPTGFVLFPVADLGATPLAELLRVAAAGPDLRGKRLIISFTPQVFIGKGHDRFDQMYRGNFSPLQATVLAFSNDLSPALARDLTLQLLKHAATIRHELLLRAALNARASNTRLGQATYFALYPLGMIQEGFYRIADDFLVWRTLSDLKEKDRPPRTTGEALNWTMLADSADRYTRAHASGNQWGIEDKFFAQHGRYFLKQKGAKDSTEWLANLGEGYGWPELDLLLRLLKERGAKPLVVTMPKHGLFDEFAGLSASVRSHYYDKFSAAVAPYGFPVETFQAYDTVKYFLNDPDSHMSPKGWFRYDQLVNAFYHDSLR
ncbi:MAG TPA: D-alanyl-lipoteichoic acid biosynthesis protein DltD [Gemmatimonadales bacterium]